MIDTSRGTRRDQKWDFPPFGRYLAPLGIFPGTYQREYAELFRKARPIDFGIGYRHRPGDTNLVLAVKKEHSAEEASDPPAPEKTETAPTRKSSRQPRQRSPNSSFGDFWLRLRGR